MGRSVLASREAAEAAAGTAAESAYREALESLSGREDPSLEGLPPDRKLLRTFDLGTVAIRSLASLRPIALLIDDLQWADEDSLRLLRYVFRSETDSPIFLMVAIRPEELALVTEAVTLIADVERAGMVRRLKLARFSLAETTEYLTRVLGSEVDQTSAATIHAQAEGVPFVVEEVVRSYREAAMIQRINDRWTLARNAERLVPSAVRTLISRRAARLPEGTTASLAQAAVLGRRFSLRDLREVKIRLSAGEAQDVGALAEQLEPAVVAGLLVEHPEGSAADYSFPHEQIREFAAETLAPAKRREVHAAIVELLLVGSPAPETLSLLAHHAKAAGDASVCVRFSIEATRNALDAHAPEEVLRVVDLALPAAASAQERLALLTARDDAFEMLRRPSDRLEGLAELGALAEALGDSHLELDVMLRRAAALRLSQEEDDAAELARRVIELAGDRRDRRAELAGAIELGQDLLRTAVGEGYSPSPLEVDLDAAEHAYERAAELAEELSDEAALAAATRELGVIGLGRLRAWFVERVNSGEYVAFIQRVMGGEPLEDVLHSLPVAPLVGEIGGRFHRALELYERLGDRAGMMSCIIAMAYLSWAPRIHMGVDSARRIEDIRKLATEMYALTSESQRTIAEVQMLYGVHVFARAKGIPDLAVTRGEDAFRKARLAGDRSLEFLAGGGTAMAYLELGETEQARTWLDRASAAAALSPTPARARQLEMWQGLTHGAMNDAEGLRLHMERAVDMAVEQGLPSARCEALAVLALEASRLGTELHDDELLSLAARTAKEAKEVFRSLGGHPPWGAQSDAALASVSLARGEAAAALEAARSALSALAAAQHEDVHLGIMLPVARTIFAAGTEEERTSVRSSLELTLATIANRIADEDVRSRWFKGPLGAGLSELAGRLGAWQMQGPAPSDGSGPELDDEQTALLRMIVQGKTNRQMAAELDLDEEAIDRRLLAMFATIGASSRADATAFAFQTQVM